MDDLGTNTLGPSRTSDPGVHCGGCHAGKVAVQRIWGAVEAQLRWRGNAEYQGRRVLAFHRKGHPVSHLLLLYLYHHGRRKPITRRLRISTLGQPWPLRRISLDWRLGKIRGLPRCRLHGHAVHRRARIHIDDCCRSQTPASPYQEGLQNRILAVLNFIHRGSAMCRHRHPVEQSVPGCFC